MERHGYIHDLVDVKVLVLFVLARVEAAVDSQTIYELCYQDDLLSYFDICQVLPEMVKTGHLEKTGEESYLITDKGREGEKHTHDSIAFSVRQRAQMAVDRYHHKLRREHLLSTEIRKEENGYMVEMVLNDPQGCIMKMELAAPTLRQARKLETSYRKNAETVYRSVMIGLLEENDEETEEKF